MDTFGPAMLFTMVMTMNNVMAASIEEQHVVTVAPVLLAANHTDIIIRPHSQTSRGAIGSGTACPQGEVATGFRMKMQPQISAPTDGQVVLRTEDELQHLDNTALNAIRLYCTGGLEAKSSEGDHGYWTDHLNCQGKLDFITGVRIKTEKWLGWSKPCYFHTGAPDRGQYQDDVGAVNFEAVCKSGARLAHRHMPSWINDRGVWSEIATCPDEAPAVCGIKARVDNAKPNQLVFQVPDLRGDQAGLTEVQFKCCPEPLH